MTQISIIHRNLTKYFQDESLIENPKKILGPNWESVINFWWFIENLDSNEKERIYQKYYRMECGMWRQFLYEVCKDDYCYFDIERSIYFQSYPVISTDGFLIFHTTIEIIIMDKIFQQDKTLKFFQIFL